MKKLSNQNPGHVQRKPRIFISYTVADCRLDQPEPPSQDPQGYEDEPVDAAPVQLIQRRERTPEAVAATVRHLTCFLNERDHLTEDFRLLDGRVHEIPPSARLRESLASWIRARAEDNSKQKLERLINMEVLRLLPGIHHASLESALDAAPPGERLEVRAGYGGPSCLPPPARGAWDWMNLRAWDGMIGGDALLAARGGESDRPWLEHLTAQASQFQPFDAESLESAKVWVSENRQEALERASDESLHGRIRWLLLESLSTHATDELRKQLVQLLESQRLDPWLMNGVPAVIRMTPMESYRQRTTRALRWWLTSEESARQAAQTHTGACGLGEILMTFGSFAEASDYSLIGKYALGDWLLKIRVNAFDAMQRTAQRHAFAPEIDTYFERNHQRLCELGGFFAANSKSSRDNTALLFSWLCAMTARLGPEAEEVGKLVEAFPRFRHRFRHELQQARSAMRRRWPGPDCEAFEHRFQSLHAAAADTEYAHTPTHGPDPSGRK